MTKQNKQSTEAAVREIRRRLSARPLEVEDHEVAADRVKRWLLMA